MKIRHGLVALAAIVAPQADVYALKAPSASDGPIRLLTCSVSAQGILEASVESQTDDAMDCSIRCNYELGDKMFSYVFSVTIPKRFQGRVGRFDTNGAKPGDYSGDLGTCRKSPA